MAEWRVGRWDKKAADTMMPWAMPLVLVVAAVLVAMPMPARSQSSLSSGEAVGNFRNCESADEFGDAGPELRPAE